jgi:hypothetical protein
MMLPRLDETNKLQAFAIVLPGIFADVAGACNHLAIIAHLALRVRQSPSDLSRSPLHGFRFASAVFVGAFTPVNDGDSDTNEMQVFDLAAANARYVRLRIIGSAGGDAFGFSGIAFGVVPEPSLQAVLVVGAICLTMASLRQR